MKNNANKITTFKQLSMRFTVALLLLSLIILPVNAALAIEPMPITTEIPMQPNAEEGITNNGEKLPNGILTAEQALLDVKDLIEIPKELDTLHSNFQQDMNTSVWNFQWFSKIGEHGEVVIRVDAKTGSIIGYHQYNPSEYYDNKYQRYVPKLTWEQGLEMAQQYVTKFSNKEPAAYQLLSQPQYPLYKGIKQYEYRFEQVVAGIPFKNQTINVTINADTGELRNFYMNWLENLVTDQQSNTSKETAENLYKEQFGLELAYIAPYSLSRDQRNNVKLVYRSIKANQFVVDATTGEVIEPSPNYYDFLGYGGDMAAKEMMDSRGKGLEEFEQAELDSISGLLNQEQALLQAMSYVEIPNKYKHTYSNMERSWDFPQNRTWNFRWEFYEQDEDRQYHGTIEVAIDAISGKLIRLAKYQYPDENQVVLDTDDILIKSEEDAIKRAHDFIAEHYPERINEIERKNIEGWKMLEGQKLPLTYQVRYQRVVNDISFDRNNISLNINAKTGEISFFQIVWADLDFPNPTGVMNVQEMVTKFLVDNPIELQYVKYFENKEQVQKTKLVYTFSKLEKTLYDALSGAPLDQSGVEKKQKASPYKDVSNHWAEEDIRFLEKYEVLPFEGENLKPNQSITQGEFMKILVKIERPYVNMLTTKDINQFVTERRLYLDNQDESWDDQSILSREEMAYLLVTFLNYQEVAKLDIYNLTFADSQLITKEKRGSVAIMNGLGVMTGGSNNQFMPLKQATRAEAIATIVKLLKK